ncbi:hypothetical protein HK098_004504 [Nowakowskiella sp. JEL0407]|nr:hypothetical protein HK098_004504 [Nowakowskiella sp. JEL0407]
METVQTLNDSSAPIPETSSTAQITNPEKRVRTEQSQKTTEFYNTLKHQCTLIEDHMYSSESLVLQKEEDAFLTLRFETDLSRLLEIQAVEVAEKKELFEKMLKVRSDRVKAKKAQKQLFRDIKKRDGIIMEENVAARAVEKIQEQLKDRSKGVEAQIAFVEAKHEKQRKQLLSAQERKISAEKTLHDLETKHLKTELRSNLAKNFNARMNHQKVLDKRILDHQRDLQLLELRQLKERAEMDEKSFEEIQSLKITQTQRVQETRGQQLTEFHLEKDRVYELKQQVKVAAMDKENAIEMKKLLQVHRAQVKAMRTQFQQLMKQRKALFKAKQEQKMTTEAIDNIRESSVSRLPSTDSVCIDDYYENDDNDEVESQSSRYSRSSQSRPEFPLPQQTVSTAPEIVALQQQLLQLTQKQKEDLDLLLTTQKQELDQLVLTWQAKQKTLDADQATELANMKEVQAREIADLVQVQEKELAMERSVHDTEMKMMLERRLLNSVLNTVVDAIITIDPVGTIKRFNHAAEIMFGYTASEIIETNIRDLMPERFSTNHDQYLNNYMTTGVKKVIGLGRRAFGLHKSGAEFPIHLSVSEVKENGVHLFTGIVRDMTRQIQNEEQQKLKEQQKQEELQSLISELETQQSKAELLLSNMLPSSISRSLLSGQNLDPESYASCTIMFLDVVQFSQLCSKILPVQTVEFLNDLFKGLDDIIDTYDAYKVESVGDSYMVVSGVPHRNEDHAGVIATMALHFLEYVKSFKMKQDPEASVQLRIGINTGPVVAGVVGLKMPRYCLFGDTVNTSSRMESSGQAMSIQCSESAHDALQKLGGYNLELRGEMAIKVFSKRLNIIDLCLKLLVG